MFNVRYWANRFFNLRYWPPVGATPPPITEAGVEQTLGKFTFILTNGLILQAETRGIFKDIDTLGIFKP